MINFNAGAKPSSLDNTVAEDISLAHETQGREESWNQERLALEAEIARLQDKRERSRSRVDALKWSNGRKQTQVDRLEGEIAKASQLTEGVAPIITSQARRAAEILDSSLPFLKQERSLRLASLSDWLKAPSTEQAEKLERLLEFFTIEAQFGHTSESWQEQIRVDHQPVTVQLLKVGRLALFYLTLDERQCGVFNPASGSFEPLPDSCSGTMKKALALANRQRSAELVELPIGGVQLP